MNAAEFEKLKRNIEEAKSKKDRLQGQLEQLNARIKKDFGCNSVEELQALYEDSKAQKTKLAKKFEENLTELETITEGLL